MSGKGLKLRVLCAGRLLCGLFAGIEDAIDTGHLCVSGFGVLSRRGLSRGELALSALHQKIALAGFFI